MAACVRVNRHALELVGAQHFISEQFKLSKDKQSQSNNSSRAPAEPPSSAVKPKYSPSDNSSSSSASLARTSAGSGTGSRSAIPPFQTDLNICFPAVSPCFQSPRCSTNHKNPKSVTPSPSASLRVRQRLCAFSANQRQATANTAELLPEPVFSK